MAVIKKYKKQDGSNAFMFNAYVGIDEMTGKKKRTTRRGFKTEKEARLALARLEVEVEEQGFKKQEYTLYKDIYELFIIEYKNTVKESTFTKTKYMFKNHILPEFGNLRIEKIDIKYCQNVMNKWFEQFKNPNKFMNYTSAVFDLAIRMNIIQMNPTKLITKPTKKIKIDEIEKEKNFYTIDELKLFLDCLEKGKNKQAYTLFRLLAFSGMRKGEALALKWTDIDDSKKTININKTVSRGENARVILETPKTTNSIRSISIDDKTLAVLSEWRKTQKLVLLTKGHNASSSDQLIFSNTKNQYVNPTRTTKWITQVQEKYNLKKITTHGLRHTHASLLFEAGATIKDVQERLGHADIQTTMNIYTHVTEKRKEETAQIVATYANF